LLEIWAFKGYEIYVGDANS